MFHNIHCKGLHYIVKSFIFNTLARMAELVDAPDSKLENKYYR